MFSETFSSHGLWFCFVMFQPQLLPRSGDIPRSGFQFDFGLERTVLAEAEKDNPDWSKFCSENPPPPKFPQPPLPSSMVKDSSLCQDVTE